MAEFGRRHRGRFIRKSIVNFVETLVCGVMVVAVSGLVTLWYKNGNFFRRLVYPLFGVMSVCVLCVGMYQIGHTDGRDMQRQVDADKLEAVLLAAKPNVVKITDGLSRDSLKTLEKVWQDLTSVTFESPWFSFPFPDWLWTSVLILWVEIIALGVFAEFSPSFDDE